jgi:hypothetical protein
MKIQIEFDIEFDINDYVKDYIESDGKYGWIEQKTVSRISDIQWIVDNPDSIIGDITNQINRAIQKEAKKLKGKQ